MLFSGPLDRLKGLRYFAAPRDVFQVLVVSCWTPRDGAETCHVGIDARGPLRVLEASEMEGLWAYLDAAFPVFEPPPRGDRSTSSAPVIDASGSSATAGPLSWAPIARRASITERLFGGGRHIFRLGIELPADPRGLWFPTRHASDRGGVVGAPESLYAVAPARGAVTARPPRDALGFGVGLERAARPSLLPADHGVFGAELIGPRLNEDLWVQPV